MMLLFVAIESAVFASFAWSIQRLFHGDRIGAGMRAIVICGTACYCLDTLNIVLHPAGGTAILSAMAGQVVAFFLFWWTAATIRDSRLSLAFSPDMPEFFLVQGPYAMMRHPFYASYIVFWTMNAVATSNDWAILPLAGMTALYCAATRLEEAKFARSGFSSAYRDYQLKVGMFFPRLWPAPTCKPRPGAPPAASLPRCSSQGHNDRSASVPLSDLYAAQQDAYRTTARPASP